MKPRNYPNAIQVVEILDAASKQVAHCSDGEGPDPGACCCARPSSLLTGVCIGATFSFAAEAGAAACGAALDADGGAGSAFTGAGTSSHSIFTAEEGAGAADAVTCKRLVL